MEASELFSGLMAALPCFRKSPLSFGFVFIHPFIDGNGRLHRLLIHNVLSQRGVTPAGVVAPVSAVMLADRASYDAALETFSKPLLELVDYELVEDGSLTVKGSTASLYRHIDRAARGSGPRQRAAPCRFARLNWVCGARKTQDGSRLVRAHPSTRRSRSARLG
jgi:hypothetical protein